MFLKTEDSQANKFFFFLGKQNLIDKLVPDVSLSYSRNLQVK